MQNIFFRDDVIITCHFISKKGQLDGKMLEKLAIFTLSHIHNKTA